MNEKELIKNVFDEILRIKEETGINILDPEMPDLELEKWVEHFVRQKYEK